HRRAGVGGKSRAARFGGWQNRGRLSRRVGCVDDLCPMKYYKTDSRKISFREYWNISPSGFLFAWFCKCLGIPLKLAGGIPSPRSLREDVISEGDVPGEVLFKMNSTANQLRQLGFDQFWYHTPKLSLIGGLAYEVHALHSSRKSIGKIIFVSIKYRQ